MSRDITTWTINQTNICKETARIVLQRKIKLEVELSRD